ncbi:MAG: polysaccharide deacetylase family protein [Paludibacter sp.]
MDKKIIVTTSWDDGHPLDTRIVELLEKYNLKGTFYVPIKNSEHQPVMDEATLREVSKNHEIGGHTVNHIYLNTIGETAARYEISECKLMLQDKLGKKIDAFCYPGGKFSQRDKDIVKNAGFLFGRTTKLLHTTSNGDPELLNTTVQAYNHSCVTLTGHCLKNSHLIPIIQNRLFLKGNKSFPHLAEAIMTRIMNNGGVFHLWGHSWEIEQFKLWNELEMVLKMCASHNEVSYLDNTECWKALNGNGHFKPA